MLSSEASSPSAELVGLSRVAVLVPRYNEEATIVEAAAKAGAIVRREAHPGKCRVVRRMFTDVDADVCVLVDGDATYDAPSGGRRELKLLERRRS